MDRGLREYQGSTTTLSDVLDKRAFCRHLSISCLYQQFRLTRRPSFRSAFAFLAAAALGFASTAHAGRYELIKGKGVEVCKTYGKNLNSFELTPYDYMRCERKISPEFSGFSKPEWVNLVSPNASGVTQMPTEVILQIMTFLEPSVSHNRQGRLENYQGRYRRGVLGVSKTRVDIDNNGTPETVLKYSDGDCELEAGHWAKPILVYDENTNSLDIKKTLPLLQNDAKTTRNVAGRWEYAMYDIFSYRGKTYFDRWSDFFSEKGFLKVFKSENSVVKEICVYQYRN